MAQLIFKNDSLDGIRNGFEVSHHIMLTYWPWSNEVILILRATLLEPHLSDDDWPDLL